MTLTRALLQKLPKVELHVHLDGCIRPATMIELAAEQGVRLPADTPEALASAMLVAHAGSLEDYLERYDITLAVTQSRDALERIAYEFVVDSAAENTRYVEVRFCPVLHMPSLTLAQAVEAPLAGIERGQAETGTMVRLILCGLRTLGPSVSLDVARAAVDYRESGVVAFDLAGAEYGHPARDHLAAFEYALGRDLACTCHAGEGDGPDSIREAVHICGVHRVGHGTRLFENPDLEAELIDRGVPLEVCLTSNRHTHTVMDLSHHPARRYFDLGGVVTLNTDSRLMDSTTMTDEFLIAHQELGFTRSEIDTLILNAIDAAFLPAPEKQALRATVRSELESTA
ncbi:MAG: adenosine deaminase [Gemmatimonadales bacterium]